MTSIRVSAVLLVDREDRVLTVRKRGTDRFMLPGGKPEPGESPAACAVRECREEVGAELVAEDLVQLGSFEAEAANEPDERVTAEVFSAPAPDGLVARAEIEELRWLDRQAALPDDLAPLLREAILPALDRVHSFTFRRPFGWGVVAISDIEPSEVPELGEGPVAATSHALLVRVRHAADVTVPEGAEPGDELPPAEVTVRVHVGRELPADPTWEGALETPSESLLVGDAESEVEIDVSAVRCRVALRLDPPDDADLLEIWIDGVA